MSLVTCPGDNDLSESVTRDKWHSGPHGVMPVMSSHASSDTVLLITYLHNGINTPSLSRRNILAPLYSRHSLSEFSLLITFFPDFKTDRLLHHFLVGILLKEAEPGFISDFFWGENTSFFNCGHFLWKDWCRRGYWTISLILTDFLSNFLLSR